MNVLVYSGPGAATEATRQAIETLRLLLSPYYAVTLINETQLLTEPWAAETTMLVMPGGADLPYCKALNGNGNTRIKQFVRKGGVYLGICAGGYYGAQQCEFEQGTPLEVSGPRELAFYRGIARGTAFKGFQYASNVGSRASWVTTTDGQSFACFYNGGSIFEGDNNAEVVLRYTEPVECQTTEPSAAAAVHLKLGAGHVFLSGVHLEYSMATLDAPDLDQSIKAAIENDQGARLDFLRSILSSMGLKVSQAAESPLVTPLHLTCMDAKLTPTVDSTLAALSDISVAGVIQDSHDSFTFCGPDQIHNAQGDKIVAVYENGATPAPADTPYFNLGLYYQILREQGALMAARVTGVGRTAMYGEVVTSTSSMIDRNPQFLKRVPHGFVCVGTQQVAGRGRGANVWVNPTGVLPVSGVLKVQGSNLRQSLVFVQYLVSLAIVEAVHSINPHYRDLGLGIKWPNDIYIQKDGSYAKIGGILVTVTFVDNTFVLVFGAGTNVNNLAPTTSLNSMIEELSARKQINLPPIRQEDLLARMMARLDEMWVVFLDLGFAPFEQRYYEHWLHTNKIVTLDQYSNQRAMVKGITVDTGMLFVQALDGQDRPLGPVYELQPDGNSFDMLKGLIKKKV